MKMNRILSAVLLLAAAALAPIAADAQSQTVYSYSGVYPTYTAVAVGLVPAASATDFLTLTGSATKTVKVTRANCTGISTAAATALLVALKRSTADTAGTSTTLTAVPSDSNLAAATAVAKAYTANPTTGTLVGNLRAHYVTTSTAASSQVPIELTPFEFGSFGANYPVVLRGVAQTFALNGNGASFSGGTTLACSVQWTEQ